MELLIIAFVAMLLFAFFVCFAIVKLKAPGEKEREDMEQMKYVRRQFVGKDRHTPEV